MMRHWQRRLPWGRHAPPAGPLVGIALAAFVVLWVVHWVWSAVVGVYFSSIVVIPWYGGHPPDFGTMFLRALRLAAAVTALVFVLLAGVAALAWHAWARPARRRGI
ncbi:MAG: hypothetical protein IMW98_10270 [Firmicutes bacterium]|nr:hypothetical protein [Bacillota bacterium]